MNYGEKIKEARLKAHMTQKELAGDKITRSMLSQIESGKAVPSLSTVRYIAERLGLPEGYLVSEAPDEDVYRKSSFVTEIKELFSAGDYAGCLKLCDLHPSTDDEILLIISESSLRLAAENYRKGRLDLTEQYLSRATESASECGYNTDHIVFEASVYLDLLRDIGYSTPSGKRASQLLEESPAFQLHLYRSMLELADSGNGDKAKRMLQSGLLPEGPYRDHIKAKMLFSEGDYLHALRLMTELEDQFITECADPVTLYRLYTDMEFCARTSGDSATSRDCARKRDSMLKKIKLPK